MFGLLFFLLKVAMVIGSFGMSVTVFVRCLRYLLACRSVEFEVKQIDFNECINTFRFTIITGGILRFLYWLLIPDLSNTLSILMIADLLAVLGTLVVSLVFMTVPFYRINSDKYRRVPVSRTSAFVKYSIAGILAEFVVIYLTGFPGTI